MKRIIALSLAALVCVAALAAPKPRTLKSSDGRIVVTIDGFKYSVTADGQQMLSPTEVGMTLTDGTVYGGKAKLQKVRTRKVDENINTVIYKKAVVRDRFNELTLEYKDFSLILRAYNEGVAYRFVSKAAKRFNVALATPTWAASATTASRTATSPRRPSASTSPPRMLRSTFPATGPLSFPTAGNMTGPLKSR